MLARSIRRLASSAKITEYRQRWAQINEKLQHKQAQFQQIKKELNSKETLNQKLNQEFKALRLIFTKDMQKTDEIWANTKQTCNRIKAEQIEKMSNELIQIGEQFHKVEKLQKKQHSKDLCQGFDLTSRMFFKILDKYKIVKTQIAALDKYLKELMQIVKEEQAEQKSKKGLVKEVLAQGWTANNKVVRKARIVLYS